MLSKQDIANYLPIIKYASTARPSISKSLLGDDKLVDVCSCLCRNICRGTIKAVVPKTKKKYIRAIASKRISRKGKRTLIQKGGIFPLFALLPVLGAALAGKAAAAAAVAAPIVAKAVVAGAAGTLAAEGVNRIINR